MCKQTFPEKNKILKKGLSFSNGGSKNSWIGGTNLPVTTVFPGQRYEASVAEKWTCIFPIRANSAIWLSIWLGLV